VVSHILEYRKISYTIKEVVSSGTKKMFSV